MLKRVKFMNDFHFVISFSLSSNNIGFGFAHHFWIPSHCRIAQNVQNQTHLLIRLFFCHTFSKMLFDEPGKTPKKKKITHDGSNSIRLNFNLFGVNITKYQIAGDGGAVCWCGVNLLLEFCLPWLVKMWGHCSWHRFEAKMEITRTILSISFGSVVDIKRIEGVSDTHSIVIGLLLVCVCVCVCGDGGDDSSLWLGLRNSNVERRWTKTKTNWRWRKINSVWMC